MAIRPPGFRRPPLFGRPEIPFFEPAFSLFPVPHDFRRIPRLPLTSSLSVTAFRPLCGRGLARFPLRSPVKREPMTVTDKGIKRKLIEVEPKPPKTNDSESTDQNKVTVEALTARSETNMLSKEFCETVNDAIESGEEKHLLELCSEAESDDIKIPCDLMQPLYCKLCETKLNGTLQACAHYEGKNHKKKERQFVEKLRKEKGIASPPLQINGKTECKEKKAVKPEDMYCKCCDVAFNSEVQARQHYNGRNHQRRLRGEPPLPKGFYNPLTGKWQRQPPTGVHHVMSKKKQKYVCTVCNSTMTSQLQLDAHFSGIKHKNKIPQIRAVSEKLETPMEIIRGPWLTAFTTVAGCSTDSILATVISNEVEEPVIKKPKVPPGRDFSMFRTPSGKYYCSNCNITLNSESQFAQHYESKKHKAKTGIVVPFVLPQSTS